MIATIVIVSLLVGALVAFDIWAYWCCGKGKCGVRD